MSSGAARWRRTTVLFAAAVCSLIVWRPDAFALNVALEVNQYQHTSWKAREGFTRGWITTIAQTHDGYLWLGTDQGLMRFDGVRATSWQPPHDQRLPSEVITGLLVSRDGTLWIAMDQGLVGWKGGRLRRIDPLADATVGRLVEDRDGAIWMTRFTTNWSLCRLLQDEVTCFGEDGGAGAGALGLYEDRAGRLWVGTNAGLWRWNPGPPTFYPMPGEVDGITVLSESDDGSLLIGRTGGIRRLSGEGTVMAAAFPPALRSAPVRDILRDRDGGVWVALPTRGLVHTHGGRTDVYAQVDGLSGDAVVALFEDREGSIWVATTEGLDRFRESTVVSYTARQGLSNGRVGSVLAARDGTVWATTFEGLNRVAQGAVTVLRERNPHAMFEDSRGQLWVATFAGVNRAQGGRLVPVDGLPGGLTRALVEDGQKTVWVVKPEHGLFGVTPGATAIERIPRDALSRDDFVSAAAADPAGDGLWLGFYRGGVVHVSGGRVGVPYDASKGLAAGRISDLYAGSAQALWVAADGGLSRLKSGRMATLTTANGLPCERVGWAREDTAGALWLGMPCGLARIERSEIDRWAAAVDGGANVSALRVPVALLDLADGVRNYVEASYYTSPASRAPDGRLWFTSRDGLSVVDPARSTVNRIPPPVHIEQVVADRQVVDLRVANEPLRLPPLVRDLQIDYTALSFVAPEKVRFRYRLDGFDREWQDAGSRRQAFYTNLPPGDYRFRVIAANNSGVWNETGAAVQFSVAPAYYQTAWFYAVLTAAGLALVAMVFQLRARQVARQFNIRLEERVAERTRIARDLHDTMLQSFQGVLLKFHATTFLLPDRPDEARASLERVIEQASQAITEGRDAVQGLRSSVAARSDMMLAITTVGEGLASDHTGEDAPTFRAYAEGHPRDLAPVIADEVYRVAVEALRNAFRHARASVIEMELHYDDRELRLRVRDDGCGIDAKVLDSGGRAGHYGLAGMHERADLVRGKLSVWSRLGAGTEVELTIPGAVAYAKPSAVASRVATAEQRT